MSGSSWGVVARRGELTVQFQTRKLAQSMGYAVAVSAELIGVIVPDGMPAFAQSFESPATAAAWCREMAPRAVTVFVADDENERALRDAIVPSKPRRFGLIPQRDPEDTAN